MVYMPYEQTSMNRKVSRPFYLYHYWMLDLHPNAITVQAVARPNDKSIWVNLDRVTLCPVKLPDESWLRQKL